MIKLDGRITLALIAAIVLQTAGAFLWAGRAAERLDAAERNAEQVASVSERMARLEEQVAHARRSLDRIERALDHK